MDREQTIETLYKLIQKQHQCKTVDCTGCKKFAQEILSLFTIEGIEMERVCKECDGTGSSGRTVTGFETHCSCIRGKQSRPVTWGDIESDIMRIMLCIAHEAHMMGRIYNSMGEPERPIDVCNKIEKMVKQKILKPARIEEGWVIKEE